MKQYTADKHAQYTLQIAAPVVSAVLIGLIWYFLAVLPHWMLWTLTVIVAAAAVLLSTLLLPMWFCTIVYSVSATHITRKCGIFFVQEQTMRTQALQFSSIFRAPFSEKTGMNFIPHSHSGISEPLRCGGDPGVSAKDGVQPQPASGGTACAAGRRSGL